MATKDKLVSLEVLKNTTQADVNDLKSAVNNIGTVSIDGLPLTIGHMMDTGKWGQLSAGSYQHFAFPVSSGDVIKFQCETKNTVVGFVTDYSLPLTSSTNVLYSSATGFTTKIAITKETPYEWTTPSDAKYLIVEKIYGSGDVGISAFTVNGYDLTTRLNDRILNIESEIESAGDAVRYIRGEPEITWQAGTLGSNGVLVTDENNRYIASSFIDLHNRNLFICVPSDGSVYTKAYFYSGSTEETFGTSGPEKSFSRITTNGTYRYCRIQMRYTDNSEQDGELPKKAFFLFGHSDTYRGKIGQLGVSAFSQCTDEGYYSFVAADVAGLSDAPYDLTSGGILITYSHFGSFTLYQVIYNTNGDKYVRFGVDNSFIKASLTPANFAIEPTYELGPITSSTGENANSSTIKRVRMADATPINGGFKLVVPTGMKAEIVTYTSSTIAQENRGETNTGLMGEGTYLFYPRYAETHFRIYGGYTDDRTISDASVGKNFKMTYFDNENSPKWLALGDSITQGYYSYNNGTSDTFGRTIECWTNYAANKANLRLINSGVGGSGYVKNGAVLDQKNAKAHVDDIDDFTGIDCITLSWGVNDWKDGNITLGTVDSTSGDGTVCGNMKYVIEKIMSENPLIKLFVITPINCAGYDKNYGSKATNWGIGHQINSKTLEDYFNAEKAIAEYYGVQLIDLTHASVVNRENLLSLLKDGVHPSISCHRLLGSEMAGKITFK